MTDVPQTDDRPQRALGGHTHVHGRPASWVLVAVIIAAFIAGGFAIVFRAWWLFWACAGVVALSVPAGALIGIMNDTVLEEPTNDERPVAEDTGSAADPGVQL